MTKLTRDERSEISRALAKAIAYRDCGKRGAAAAWAARLVTLLGESDVVLSASGRSLASELAD